jgi:hypothetical protein
MYTGVGRAGRIEEVPDSATRCRSSGREELAMAKPWADRVKNTGHLSIYPDSLAGGWPRVFDQALREFNTLSRTNRLGVTLTRSGTPPAISGSGGADVAVRMANGAISFTYGGSSWSGHLDGSVGGGHTRTYTLDGRIEKAWVFLPMRPQVPLASGGRREVGAPVKLVIAVHELVHACGLENPDHCPADLFHPQPEVDYGSTPAGDRARITDSLRMPPLRLSEITAGRIRTLWTRR